MSLNPSKTACDRPVLTRSGPVFRMLLITDTLITDY
jgi:hypothetical protein